MKINVSTYWGPNRYSKRPSVVFCFEEIPEEKMSVMQRSFVTLAKYLEKNFGYSHTFGHKRAIDRNDVFEFLSSASIFILNFARGDLEESGYITDNAVPVLFVEFHKPELTAKAVNILLKLLFRGAKGKEHEFHSVLNTFWDECQRGHPDFQAHALITAAKSKNLYYQNLDKKVWLYGMGAKSKIFFETSTVEDLQSDVKTDKLSGKKIFNTVGAPTARYKIVRDRAELLAAAHHIGFPCAVKPVHSDSGRGVTANVRTLDDVEFAYTEARKFIGKSNEIMVEKHVPGRDYRLLFLRGDFIGCASSVAPFVIGDGAKSIRELIDVVNSKRTRNLYASNYLRPIKIDASVKEALSVQGCDLKTVLKPGQKVTLRRNTNLGGGGSTELFENVHHDVLIHAKEIARCCGLHSVGIDYITEDISKSPSASGGNFTELNKMPGVPLFLAAGYDIGRLGDQFLGNRVGNIELNLFIFQKERCKELLQSYSGDCAIFLPDTVVKKSKKFKVEDVHFRQLIGKVLSDRQLKSLDIIATLEFIEQYGFPTEHISTVFVGEFCKTRIVRETAEKLNCHVQCA
ncbi:ATP-grasp domain-containing protein [Prosthecochloris sp. SCSIO W1101]|uniref:ATP-grasp domain-containing protein n=1 Tax=Prosthecochloris sp. SCSIO W1101 TaxID=2992242 RepID=UPI00223D1BC1|nr:ATP-grasp domain-containing protein [Prosthecochloris sp. SCSIO W1101]UZJ42403.1 ATP-grasp domain-containing protein [Prosthecochloris sp. SCSIO W1101]